ncbi:UbiH/UbiF/VisC/COQ6 family ubiquinone biosynthesis hydroxylase [Massilia sp. IC2-476]|uniref:UbiH/UbiF/VisC/COQ6 family ubiquinone biosynthesis hydroxylase n=1 Tax=Massilia sp. IC2-476 TaxID=2887199 RepID=UPI001D108E81|nr:UbiH/UbiF/VisC/COQ6 family ubiquinone biosynthesis hydroxylase [Massilia sp. IC2-476]MCC2973455.1 UbiH/UbiF/VisC/COQ6 family ubiquinone biosynthesis hydroxylase [Massilia sp. IC2-476]
MADEVLDIDVAICGAGPVGLALAAQLVRRGADGKRVALIDAKSLGQAITDPRSIALSWGSVQLLEEVRAWPLPATPIHEIHVSRRGQLGRSLMDRAEHRLPALGYVARYGDVVDALARACDQAGVQTLRPARVDAFDEQADRVHLVLDDGRRVSAQVAVQAEGGVFGQQDSCAQQRDYGQTALIARVSVSEPVAHRAFERFTDEGPLALLPQDGGDGHQYALVWCMRPERATDIQLLDDDAFLARLGEAFGARLGKFTAASPRVAFPLGLNAEARATGRTVAIGNAAQTLHPVAGQGLNLGLRDAAVLARQLARGATPDAVDAFMSERAQDRRLTISLTDTMARAFTGGGPLQPLLGLSLAALDLVKPARLLLADLMMFGRR